MMYQYESRSRRTFTCPIGRLNVFVLFEWDENKQRSVVERHGIDFEDAVQIFDGPVWETLSPRTGE